MTLPPVQSGHKEGSEDDAKVRQGDTVPWLLQDEGGGWSLEEPGDANILATKIKQF